MGTEFPHLKARICTFAAEIRLKTNCACCFFLIRNKWPQIKQTDVRLTNAIDIIIIVHSKSIAKSKPEPFLENAFLETEQTAASCHISDQPEFSSFYFVCFSRFIRFFWPVFLDLFYPNCSRIRNRNWSWSRNSISNDGTYSLKANDWLCIKNLKSCETCGRAHTPVQYIHGRELLNTRIDSVKRKSCKFTLIRYMHYITYSLHGMAWHSMACVLWVHFACDLLNERVWNLLCYFGVNFNFFSLLSNSMHIAHNQSLFAMVQTTHTQLESNRDETKNDIDDDNGDEFKWIGFFTWNIAFTLRIIFVDFRWNEERKMCTLRMRSYNSNKVNMEMHVMHFGIAHRLFR